MKRLLWIGSLESDEEFKIKSRKGYNLASAQVSQKNILSGLEKVSGLVFDSINGSVLPPYPIYSDRVIEEVVWLHNANAYNVNVGYKNKKYVNRLTCKKAMVQAARKWVDEKYNNEELTVFVYSMRSPVMATACEIKRLIPSSKIYLIVTDLPQFMDLGQSIVKAFLKKFDWLQIKNMQQKFDGFILYSAKMAEFLGIPDGKWVLMEGLYDTSDRQNCNSTIKSQESKKKAIMYSGKLDLQYGIDMLLNAFMKINNPDTELWLTGSGNAVPYIRECAEKDSRIKFHGFLPSRQDVLSMQNEATLLVNMRLPSESASAYCFPSKLLEYMATGIPVLSFKLEGVPADYYKHLVIVEEEDEKSLMEAIESILAINDNDLINKGISARDFVLTEKNKYSQAKHIYDWIKKEV